MFFSTVKHQTTRDQLYSNQNHVFMFTNISKLNAIFSVIIFIFIFFEYIFLGIFVLFFLLITNNNQ